MAYNELPSRLAIVSSLAIVKAIVSTTSYLTRLARVPPTPETLDLLNGLLAYDPRTRLTTRDAVTHPYFTSWPLPQPPEAMPSFAAHSFAKHTAAHVAAAERYTGRATRPNPKPNP